MTFFPHSHGPTVAVFILLDDCIYKEKKEIELHTVGKKTVDISIVAGSHPVAFSGEKCCRLYC